MCAFYRLIACEVTQLMLIKTVCVRACVSVHVHVGLRGENSILMHNYFIKTKIILKKSLTHHMVG